MLGTGSSLSWIQTTQCLENRANFTMAVNSISLCNRSPKFDPSLSTTLVYRPETITAKYTEDIINTQLVSDRVVLGIPTSRVEDEGSSSGETETFGLTADVSGDAFLLRKEFFVPGFLGANQRQFGSESGKSEYCATHIFADTVRALSTPVFSLAFTATWGTLTLGGLDPSFYSQPLSWMKTLPDEPGWVTQLSPQISLIPGDASFSVTGSSNSRNNSDARGRADDEYVQTGLDRVWFDSGTTNIWGDERAIRPLNIWIGADPITGQVNCTTVSSLGKIVFLIGGETGSGSETQKPGPRSGQVRLELSPSEYIIVLLESSRKQRSGVSRQTATIRTATQRAALYKNIFEVPVPGSFERDYSF
ncbi:hypothetical protein BGZ54_010210 [Gamsiella multidivaricata]|nr:hypothetical protein BGZ54_010210 [Gamsiella multidivaricata]